MNRKIIALATLIIIAFSALSFFEPGKGALVFSDNFGSGSFSGWRTCMMNGSSQTITNGIAHFITPTPPNGQATYSYLLKDGFISTPNSTIIASEDIFLPKVPAGCAQGDGAFFFFYICDSTDLAGSLGNFGVGVDGSQQWSLWIGGSQVYTYLFQTAGALPVSGTWYHIMLIADNPSGTVTLVVNGTTVINAPQQQFTNKTHSISLMTGMGEDWYCQVPGPHEIDVDNVQLNISDMQPIPSPTQTTEASLLSPTQTTNPTISATQPLENSLAPAKQPAATPEPTTRPLPSDPTLNPTSNPTEVPANQTEKVSNLANFQLTLILFIAVFFIFCAVALSSFKKK